MFNTQKSAILLMAVLSLQITYLKSSQRLAIKACPIAAAGCIGYGMYKASPFVYDALKSHFIDKIETEIADDIVLLNTSNRTLNKLVSPERESKLKKKAWLQERKATIFRKLNEIISSRADLSEEHKQTIKKQMAILNLYLGVSTMPEIFSIFVQENPYKDHYKKSTIRDWIIDYYLVNAIIMYTKPDSECSAQELAAKDVRKVSVTGILLKIAGHLKQTAHMKWNGLKQLLQPVQ